MVEPGLYNYWIVIVLMMAGFYTVISRGNLIKKLIGLNVFQVSVFMLYISMGKVEGGIAPILIEPMPAHGAETEHDSDGEQHAHDADHDEPFDDDKGIISNEVIAERLSARAPGVETAEAIETGHAAAEPGKTKYSNPLPHVLILTAIVVGVATTSLGLALVVRINEAYGTIEEDQIQSQDDDS